MDKANPNQHRRPSSRSERTLRGSLQSLTTNETSHRTESVLKDGNDLDIPGTHHSSDVVDRAIAERRTSGIHPQGNIPNNSTLSKQKSDRASQKSTWLAAWTNPNAAIQQTINPCVALLQCGENQKGPADEGYLVIVDYGSAEDDTSRSSSVRRPSSAFSVYGMGRQNAKTQTPRSILKLFKADQCVLAFELDCPPSAVVPLPNSAMFAVAAGDSITVYSLSHTPQPALSTFRTIQIPSIDPHPIESEIWTEQLSEANIGATEVDFNPVPIIEARSKLEEIRTMPFVELSLRSKIFLSIDADEEVVAFVRKYGGVKPIVKSTVTAMTSISRTGKDASLVVGILEKMIYILSPPGFSITHKFQLSSPVVMISAWGNLDSDFHLIVCCRDGHVYLLKENACNRLGQLEILACEVIAFRNSVVIGSMASRIHSYSLQGVKQFTVTLPSSITAMEDFLSAPGSLVDPYLVALANGQVRVYSHQTCVSIIKYEDAAIGIAFGTFARAQHSLVGVMKGGGINVHVLRRGKALKIESPAVVSASNENISLDPGSFPSYPPKEQEIPINVPKKTKAFLDIMQREKADSAGIYQRFQRDLSRLRNLIESSHSKLQSSTSDPTAAPPLIGPDRTEKLSLRSDTTLSSRISLSPPPSTATSSKNEVHPFEALSDGIPLEEIRIKLETEVLGKSAPRKIRLHLQNMSSEGRAIAQGLLVILRHDDTILRISPPMLQVPFMIPGFRYTLECECDERESETKKEANGSSCVQVFVVAPPSLAGQSTGSFSGRVIVSSQLDLLCLDYLL
ncbi:ciliary BBSome complex subunit 1-domain-containing protein [Cladochytrium replicatum]|nr:ciliary BBSome complex subunit 1-domain-containing protein [Cladochytrium replicatum]